MSENFINEEEQKKLNEELFKFIDDNDLNGVKSAVQRGADVNTHDKYGYTPLCRSIDKDTNIMKYLLENGANPNLQNICNKWTPLHGTAFYGYFESTKILLKYKADMTLNNNFEETPFAYSLLREHYEIAELFVMNGYVPVYDDFQTIEDMTKRKSLRTHFMALASKVREHQHELSEEAKTAEFAYADEIIEM